MNPLRMIRRWRTNRRLDREAAQQLTPEQRQVLDVFGVSYRFGLTDTKTTRPHAD